MPPHVNHVIQAKAGVQTALYSTNLAGWTFATGSEPCELDRRRPVRQRTFSTLRHARLPARSRQYCL